MTTHTLNSRFRHSLIRVALAGVGGNGSQILTGLARIHLGLRAVGHPAGLHVTAYDPDQISGANVGRQLFSQADIGQYKSILLTHRVNCTYGLGWEARPHRFTAAHGTDLVISCVDTAAARREIHGLISGGYPNTPAYWLDLGNEQKSGQVILGEPDAYTDKDRTIAAQSKRADPEHVRQLHRQRLPTVTDRYPELLDKKFKEDNRPSCSLAESLGTQDLFINQALATFALDLLWQLLRHGEVDKCGFEINLESGRVNPLPVPGGKA